MAGERRGPLCGETNRSFRSTPGPAGTNDAGDQDKPVLVADRRGPVGSASRGPSAAGRRPGFTFDAVSPPYTGPPYILGKPEIADRLIRQFLLVARKTHPSRAGIVQALTGIADRELQRLGAPLPTTPKAPPGNPMAAGGFSYGNEEPDYPQGLWEIKLAPTRMDLTPQNTPKEFAEQCGTVAHEYEHLIDTYCAVRFAVARGDRQEYISKEMSIPARVIKVARSQPLKKNSDEYLQAEELYWFDFFTRLDKKKSNPTKDVSDLSIEYFNRHRKVRQLKRYNALDREQLDLDYNKTLTWKERSDLIKKLEPEMKALKKKIAAARKRYTALPKETVGHIVEEIFRNAILKALGKGPAGKAP